MNQIVTLHNLDAGIRYWRDRKRDWPADLHNQLYQQLRDLARNGLNGDWWRSIVDILWDWRAIRPKSKAFVFERGTDRLTAMQRQYQVITGVLGNQPSMDLATAEWSILAPLFETTRSIKGVQSPVFPSKLCHFILPSLYPVIDRAVVGLDSSYQAYWDDCRQQWLSCAARNDLIDRLKKVIVEGTVRRQGAPAGEVAADYPWSTKITELCLIGSRVPTSGTA